MSILFLYLYGRAMEVCIELNLANGASFHNKLSQYRLYEDEQAK